MTVSTSGFNIHTVGVILMIVGALGLILSLLWMTMWADRSRRRGYRDDAYVDRGAPPPAEPY